MASDVDICNAALAELGDAATVASIDPPSGSAQSAHCARFYPIARDALLEMHTWGFATVRVTLALLSTNPSSTWQYCYASPTDVLNYLSVLDGEAQDDYSVGLPVMGGYGNTLVVSSAYAIPPNPIGVYTPQPFVVESAIDTGAPLIFTNQASAVLRYTRSVSDTTQFSPLFVATLVKYLASMLAGPIVKGSEGVKLQQMKLQEAMTMLQKAASSDSNQRRVTVAQGPAWMVGR